MTNGISYRVYWFDRPGGEPRPVAGIEVSHALEAVTCIDAMPDGIIGGVAVSVSSHGENGERIVLTTILARRGHVEPGFLAALVERRSFAAEPVYQVVREAEVVGAE